MTEKRKDIKKFSFEEALIDLEAIVRQLESGSIKLEDALDAYERGISLKNHCQTKLNEAKLKIEKITLNKEGKPDGVEPFNIEQ